MISGAFDAMYNKAYARGSTDCDLGSVFPSLSCYMASLEQVAGHSFSFGFCCDWYSCPSLPPCYCRACEGDGAFILLVYFVSFLLFLAASSPTLSSSQPCHIQLSLLEGDQPT